jgi:hypothetical protein
MWLGPARFKARGYVPPGGNAAETRINQPSFLAACCPTTMVRCALHGAFTDAGKLSSIMSRKAASIMWPESAADTCS